jgi:hypothetical protein
MPGAAPADRGMLLGEIQSGKRLRRAQTNDRSGSGLAGKVIGEDPSSQHHPPPRVEADDKRRSVDWMGGMAADGMRLPTPNHQPSLTTHAEESTSQQEEALQSTGAEDCTKNFDMSQSKYETNVLKSLCRLTLCLSLLFFSYPGQVPVCLCCTR